MKTFEEYLQDKFWEQYNGLDDEAPDAENEWFCDLSPDEWIDYAESWMRTAYKDKIGCGE